MSFRSTSIILIISLIILCLLNYLFSISLWLLSLPILAYIGMLIYGSAVIRSNFYLPAQCEGISTNNEIAITFDDGPHPVYTPKVLALLAEQQVPATFFVIGKNIKGNEKIIQQINEAGHTIGNHTFSHSFFIDLKNTIGFIFELDLCSDAVFKIINKRMKFFRPPYGVTTPNVAKASKALNYSIIGWNIRSLDTTKDTEEIIFERIKKQIKPGAIILFHDSSEKTICVLKQTLNFVEENGFKVVSVEQLLNINAYE